MTVVMIFEKRKTCKPKDNVLKMDSVTGHMCNCGYLRRNLTLRLGARGARGWAESHAYETLPSINLIFR